MSHDEISVLVKVGIRSASRFRNAKVYRAITIDELRQLYMSEESNIIVIEHIEEDEYTNSISFISEYLGASSKNHIFFFVPDNDSVTTGAADELELDIYLDLKTLYKGIESTCGINLDTDIYLNKDKKEILDDDDPFSKKLSDIGGIDDIFSIQNTDIEDIREIETTVIRNKFDADIDRVSNSELGIKKKQVIESEEVLEELIEEAEVPVEAEEEREDIKELKKNLEEVQNSLEETKNKLEDTTKQHKIALNKIDNLNKIIKSVQDERDTYKYELEILETSDILEDPHTIYDFKQLQDSYSKLQEESNNKSNLSDEEVAKLTAEKDVLLSRVEELTAKNEDLEVNINELGLTRLSLERELAEAKNDTAKDDQITELIGNINDLNSSIDKQKSEIEQLNSEIIEKSNEISSVNTSLELSMNDSEHYRKLLNSAVSKLTITHSLEEQIKVLINSNDQLESDLNDTRAKLTDSQNNLNRVIADTEKRIELAKNFVKGDLDNTRRELDNERSVNTGLKAQIDILSAQLMAKESQYNNLVKVAGMDESGANTVLENNRILESMNATLRNQVSELRKNTDTLEREKLEQMKMNRNLQDTNSKLQTQIKAMSSGFSGLNSNSTIIPRINYDIHSNRAQVISVFGSGSYGITTTAYSIAYNLCSNSKVLFIDFDMVSAKADSWFKISPMIKDIPGVVNNSKASGLGIMVEYGIAFALRFFNMVIQNVTKTKGGVLDYLSGFYDRPDLIKLVSCDFSGLLNFLARSYDYIIVDLGRIGSSDISNQFVKLFTDISRSSVIVTSSDRIDIRNARIEIQKNKLLMNNMNWLINLAESTKVDEVSRNKISPAEFIQMPFIDDFYGKKKDFSKDRVSRDRFNMFLNKCILGR